MFICEIWLFEWFIPQFCTSDMSKYGYLGNVSEGPFDFEITRVDCIFNRTEKTHRITIFLPFTPPHCLTKIFLYLLYEPIIAHRMYSVSSCSIESDGVNL